MRLTGRLMMGGSWLLFLPILFLSGPVEAARFSYALPFSEGLTAVCRGCQAKQEGKHAPTVGGKWEYISLREELLIPPAFEEASDFENGRALVKVKGEWKAIDRKGEFVKDPSDISQQGEGKAEPLSGRRLFKLVEDLIRQRPFTPEGVVRLTGCHLHPDPASSNVYFIILKSGQDPQKTLIKVELRVPTKMSGKKDGLLIVSVNPSSCISAKEVLFHFGREPEVHAEPPELGGFYYQYSLPWGDLRFAFDAGEPACLRVVAIDAITLKSREER